MNLNTQENIRKIELIIYLGTLILNKTKMIDYDKITLLELPYMIDFITSFRTQKLTKEWLELKDLYEKVITNTKNIMCDIGNIDPISIFATYIYLYRNGYLSYNQNFQYSNNLKDFASLHGIDVLRGFGVCRSISSLLTSIYKEFGYYSRTLLVKYNQDVTNNNIKLSPMQIDLDENEEKVSDIIVKLTKFIYLPNHAITLVSDNFHSYKLDPTNDCMYVTRNFNMLKSPISNNGTSFNFALLDLLYSLLGNFENDINLITYSKNYSKDEISTSEYKEIYMNALNTCLKNQPIINEFFLENQDIYEEIFNISNNSSNYLRRIFPIIPKK